MSASSAYSTAAKIRDDIAELAKSARNKRLMNLVGKTPKRGDKNREGGGPPRRSGGPGA